MGGRAPGPLGVGDVLGVDRQRGGRATAWATAGPTWGWCCSQARALAQLVPAAHREALLVAAQEAAQAARGAAAALDGAFWALVRRWRPADV